LSLPLAWTDVLWVLDIDKTSLSVDGKFLCVFSRGGVRQKPGEPEVQERFAKSQDTVVILPNESLECTYFSVFLHHVWKLSESI
jgi:hypothetical protein